jgi:hypothetical protein
MGARSTAAVVVAAAFMMISATDVVADCTCRALGRDFELGQSVCLQTPRGPRLATCGMNLNNTSWEFSDTPCVSARADPPSVLNLKFATLLGSGTERTSNSKSTLESIFSSVAYDSEIRSEASIDMWRISESPH